MSGKDFLGGGDLAEKHSGGVTMSELLSSDIVPTLKSKISVSLPYSSGKGTIYSTNLTSGSAWWYKYGKLVIVCFDELIFNNNMTGGYHVFMTNLPPAIFSFYFVLGITNDNDNINVSKVARAVVDVSGKAAINYSSVNTNKKYCGTVCYIANE